MVKVQCKCLCYFIFNVHWTLQNCLYCSVFDLDKYMTKICKITIKHSYCLYVCFTIKSFTRLYSFENSHIFTNIKEFREVYNALRLSLTFNKILFCSIHCPSSTFKIKNNNRVLSYLAYFPNFVRCYLHVSTLL